MTAVIRRVALLLAAGGALLALLPPGVVLCVQRDGAVEMESAAFPCCGSCGREAPFRPDPAAPATAPSPCDDCVDLAVPALEGVRCTTPGARAEGAAATAPVLPAAAVPLPALPEAAPPRAASPRGAPPPALPDRTVVLRC